MEFHKEFYDIKFYVTSSILLIWEEKEGEGFESEVLSP